MTPQTGTITKPSPAPNTPTSSLPAGHPPGTGDTGPCGHEHDVLRAIRNTTFGTIEVTVHQSRIVQITRSEKLRF
jgi:hypothetical protein